MLKFHMTVNLSNYFYHLYIYRERVKSSQKCGISASTWLLHSQFIVKLFANRARMVAYLGKADIPPKFRSAYSCALQFCVHNIFNLLFYGILLVYSRSDARWVHTSLYFSLTFNDLHDSKRGEDCCSVHQYAPCATPSLIICPQKL